MIGHYVTGCGKASRNMGVMENYFHCTMLGTFNMRADRSIETFRPCIADTLRKFWLVKLNGQHYAWAYRWNGSGQPGNLLELVSRTPLPDSLKTGEIRIDVLEQWDKKTIDKWAADQYWFQSFPWGPKRSNSNLIWETVRSRVKWSGKTVLDIGCNYGAHSFEASKAGARVIGFDKDSRPIETARIINDNIEMQDVAFTTTDPGGTFDVIFYFSVHHQFDRPYARLKETLLELQARANDAVFVELIVPDMDNTLTDGQIDKLVGGKVLHTYRHAVRGNRRIYQIEGRASGAKNIEVCASNVVDIVIPTWKRPEKLARCLESIKRQTYKEIRVHAIEDTDRLFAFGVWNRFLASWDTGGYFVYLCDDTELAPNCIQEAVKVFSRRWPDGDGVVGFHQQIADKGGWCQSAMGMVGRAFAERFPSRQLFCPDYGRFHADSELGATARKLSRFEYGRDASLVHYHPAHCPAEMDATHQAVREIGPVARDKVTQSERRKRGLVWGLNFELINGKE